MDSSINRIAVIGNGCSALDNKGSDIDSYDCVVRMNNYVIKGYEDKIGTRTDLYAFSFHPKIDFEPRIAQQNLCVVNPTFIKNHANNYRHIDNTFIIRMKEKEWLDIFKYQPSTGIRTLYYLSKFGFEEMYITGFSFGHNPTESHDHYYEERNHKVTGHNYSNELKWLRENKKEYMKYDKHLWKLMN